MLPRGGVMSSSKWVGRQVHRVRVWIWIWYCSDQKVKWVTISNSLGRSPDPRSIGLISSMISQARVIVMCKWINVLSQSTTHHLIYGPVMTIYNWKYDRNSKVIKVSTVRWLQMWLKNFYQRSKKWMRCEKQHCHEIDTPSITKYLWFTFNPNLIKKND